MVALPAERVLNVFLSAHCASPVRQSVTNLAIATTRAGDRVDSSEVLPMRPGLGDYDHDLQDRVNATSALTSRPPPASPARRELMCASTCPHPCLPNCAILTCSNCAHTTSTARSYGKSPAKSPLRNRRSARRRLARFGVLVTHSEPQRRDAGPHGCLSSLAMARRPLPTLDARPDDPGSGDAAAHGLDGCLDAVVELEFGEDAGDVVVDGVGAERELVRDVVIGLPRLAVRRSLVRVRSGRPDRARGVVAGGGDGMSRSRMRCRSFPAIWEEMTDSGGGGLTAAMIAFGGAVLRM